MARFHVLVCVLSLVSLAVAHQEAFPELPPSDESIVRWPQDGQVQVVLNGDDDETSSSVLRCQLEDSDDSQPLWFRVDTTGERLQLNEDMEGVHIDGAQLTVDNTKLDHLQVYSCQYNNGKEAYFRTLISEGATDRSTDVDADGIQVPTLFRLDKFKRSYSVVEKEDLKITCLLVNRTDAGIDTSEIGIKWYMWENLDDMSYKTTLGNCTTESMSKYALLWRDITDGVMAPHDPLEPHIKFLHSDGVNNSMMKIEDAERSDRRGYKCVAYNLTNPEECYEAVTFIRVKDKYAALWPFLGIVAEVVVLCSVIFFFERRRASKEDAEEEEEDDVASGLQPTGPDQSNVRQRRQ